MADSDEVKTILSSILVSEKNGLTLPALDGEYRSMNGAGIPFKSLGYATLQAYVGSIPDAVTLRRSPNGEWMAQVVCTTETAHVRRMVAEQKAGKPGPHRPLRNWDQKPRRQEVQPYRPFPNRFARNPQRPNATSEFVIESQCRPVRPWNNGAGNGVPFRPKMWNHPNRFVPRPWNPWHEQNNAGARWNTRNNSNNVPVHNVNWNVHRHNPNWNVHKLPASRPTSQREPQQNAQGNRKVDRDSSASTIASWVMFLVSADVFPGVVRRYATLLSKRGLTPDNAWVMTGEDLFRIGVRNPHHIHLIQCHAHKVGAAMGILNDGMELNEDSFSLDLAPPRNTRQSTATKRSASSRTIADRSGVLQVTVRNERCGDESVVDAVSRSIHKAAIDMDLCDDSDSEEDSSDYENVPPPKVLSKVRRASQG
ncbi:unnamed protein product, partial [Ixodes hexagonus]